MSRTKYMSALNTLKSLPSKPAFTRTRNFLPVAKQFLLFACVGLSGMAVGLGILNLCMYAWHNFVMANFMAFVVAVTWNFVLNRRFTFQPTEKPFFRQWFEFVIACLGGTILNWAISMGLYYNFLFFNHHYNLAAIAGIGVAAIFNFVVSRTCVFKQKTNNPPVYQTYPKTDFLQK